MAEQEDGLVATVFERDGEQWYSLEGDGCEEWLAAVEPVEVQQ